MRRAGSVGSKTPEARLVVTSLEAPSPSAAAPPRPAPPSTQAVTWRSVLISLLLLPANSYWVLQMERVRYSAHPTTISILFNAVFGLLVVYMANRLVARLRPSWELNQGELMVIYTTLTVSSVLAGHDMMQVLAPMLSWPYRFATADNRWQDLFMSYLPSWLMVSDPEIIRGYYEGNSSLYRLPILRAWMPVVFWWTVFIGLLLWVMLCMNCVLRKQWSEREKLSYPIAQVPLMVSSGHLRREDQPSLWSNPVFWIGFGLAGTVDVINSLNLYFPWIPSILTPGFGQSFLDLGTFATQRPLSAIGWTPISWYPFIIGLGMLMPVDFLFSMWFFYLLWKAELVVTSAAGWDQIPKFPYQNDQAFGAYMAFLIFTLFLARSYLKQVFLKVVGRPSELDDSDEPISYRAAVIGMALGFVGLVVFTTCAGMTPWLAVAFFAIFFALSLAVTRMRAELGTPVHDLHFTGPDWILSEAMGTRNLSVQNLTILSLFYWFNRAYRSHPMPHQLEGFRLAERTQSSQRSWFWFILFIGIAGTLSAFWGMLHLMYSYGASAKSGTFGPEAYDRLVGWLSERQGPSYPAIMAILVGLGAAFFLEIMRVRFPWWPFHPLGFAVTASWEINLVWMPIFIAWLLKMLILRYMGLPGFRRSLPFFIGLMLGQFVVGSILNIIGILLEVPTYQFWQ